MWRTPRCSFSRWAPRPARRTRGSRTPTRCAAATARRARGGTSTFYDLHVAVSPARQQHPRLQRASPIAVLTPATRDADRSAAAARGRQHGAGRRSALTYRRDGNAFFVTLAAPQRAGAREDDHRLLPRQAARRAKRPPWDGGFIWQHDSLGNRGSRRPIEGLGASVWWPNKDIAGRRAGQPAHRDHRARSDDGRVERPAAQRRRTTPTARRRTSGSSTNPINNYDVAVERRAVRALRRHATRARRASSRSTSGRSPTTSTRRSEQFAQAKPMLKCFEHWFGPYPWYEDGYKLDRGAAPRHGAPERRRVRQPATRTATAAATSRRPGWGMKWDFIIVHESAHEWWGNNITTKDHADMWVHESFANYAEGLYTECQYGKAGRRGVHHRQPPQHQERRADHRHVRRERRRLGRHVLQGRQHAAHDPPDRRRRREVARHPARAQQRRSGTRP